MTPVEMIGLLTFLVMMAAFAVWQAIGRRLWNARHFGPVQYKRNGSAEATGDLVLTLAPVEMSGHWLMEVRPVGDRYEASVSVLELQPEGRPITIGTVAGLARKHKSSPEYWHFYSDDPRRVQVAFHVRYTYVAPLEIRSFRIARKLHGKPMTVGWSVTLRSRRPPTALPVDPTRADLIYGFPVASKP